MGITAEFEENAFINGYELDRADEVILVLKKNPVYVSKEIKAPLTERIGNREEIRSALEKLQSDVGKEAFDAYIETLLGLKFNGTSLLLIVKNGLHRSKLMREFLPALERAFGTAQIRVILETII